MMTDRLRKTLFWAFVCATALFLLVPTLIIVPMSFSAGSRLVFPPEGFSLRWYGKVLSDPDWRAALGNSLLVGSATAVLASALGTAAAMMLNAASFRGKALVLGFLLSPMVTPVIVFGVGSYLVFARWGLAGTHAGLIAAHTVLAIPFVLVSVLASLRMVNPNLALASAGLGASRLFTFRRVTLPLILPGVISGAVFAFITSWDEVVVAMFVANTGTRTVPIMIWNQVRTSLDPATAAVGAILIAVSALGVVLSYTLKESDR